MAKIRKITDETFINDLKTIVESSNINLLLGAGFSYGITDTLQNTEKILEQIEQYDSEMFVSIKAQVFWDFHQRTIYPLIMNIDDENLKNQIEFVKLWKNIIDERESAVLNKQTNVFTTNYDVILEHAFESVFVDYNDGFKGRIKPYFSTGNFNRLYFARAIFTNRSVEIPIFNLLKLHGSVTWKIENAQYPRIEYNDYKRSILDFYKKYEDFFSSNKETFGNIKEKLGEIGEWEKCTEDELKQIVPQDAKKIKKECMEFVKDFKSSFKIVNPTKQKFNDTLMDKNYYELMRIYSNELEKNNTTLIAQGFSFEDEHIYEITMRALANPSLTLIIFAYEQKDVNNYKNKFEKFQNVWIVRTPDLAAEDMHEGDTEIYLDLALVNKCMKKVLGVFEHE